MGIGTRVRLGRSLLSSVLLAAACTPKLQPVDGAQFSCTSDDECPGGMLCEPHLGRCYQPGKNLPPSVTIGLIARTLPPITIPLTVFDAESDAVALKVEYDAGQGFVTASVTGGTSTSSPDGVAHDVIWDAATDLGGSGYRGGLRVRISPSDPTGVGTATVSDSFSIGNDAPVIDSFGVDDQVVVGDTVLRFHVSDSSRDTIAVSQLQLSLAGDFSDSVDVPFLVGKGQDFPAGGLDDLTTDDPAALPSPVVPHALVWDSLIVAPVSILPGGGAQGARLALVVTDTYGAASASVVSDYFFLHNATTPPVVSITSAPAASGPGLVSLAYHLADADGFSCRVVVEYSLDGGGTWTPAQSSSETVGLLAGDYTFDWASTQAGFGAYAGVLLRLTPSTASDTGLPAQTAPFDVDNSSVGANAPPSVTLSEVAPATGGRFLDDVTVHFTVADENSADSAHVVVRYALSQSPGPCAPANASWMVASGGCDGAADCSAALAAGPSGTTHDFVWHALGDLPTTGVMTTPGATSADTTVLAPLDGVRLCILATDTATLPATSLPGLSPSFAVGNEPPTITLTAVTGNQREGIPVQVDVADPLDDLADLQVQFSSDGGATWSDAAISLGATTGLATTLDGSTYVVVWDSAAKTGGVGSVVASDVELRVRALDHPQPTVTHYGAWAASLSPFVVANQTPPTVDSVAALRGSFSGGVSPVAVTYRLTDEESDLVDVHVEYSYDAGRSWFTCREYPDTRSEGRYDLAAAPSRPDGSGGIVHTFVWDPTGTGWSSPVSTLLRVTAADGRNAITNAAQVQLASSAAPAGASPLTSPFVRIDSEESMNGSCSSGAGQELMLGSGDFDGDGCVDFIVVQVGYGTHYFIANQTNGHCDGSFTPGYISQYGDCGAGIHTPLVTDPPKYETPRLVVGDFNHDGKAEALGVDLFGRLSACSYGSGSMGASPIGAPSAGGIGGPPLVAVDVTGDGIADIIAGCYCGATGWGLCITPGNGSAGVGDGTFDTDATTTIDATCGGLPATAAMAVDLDQDGALDLVTGTLVLRGDGLGHFTTVATPGFAFPASGAGGVAMAVADVDGDGILDIVFKGSLPGALEDTWIYLGTGSGGVWDGNFAAPIGYAGFFAGCAVSIEDDWSCGLTVTDVNGDGIPDLTGFRVDSSGTYGVVAVGVGDGHFLPRATFPTGGALAKGAVTLDVNNDGLSDLVVIDMHGDCASGGPFIRLAAFLAQPDHGLGASSFAPATELKGNNAYIDFAVGDFNGDGRADLAAVQQPPCSGECTLPPVRLALFVQGGAPGVGSGTFGTPTFLQDATGSLDLVRSPGIATADVNADGILDLVMVGSGASGPELLVWLGNGSGGAGDGTFTAQPRQTILAASGLAVADVDGDGALDLVSTDLGANVVVLLGHETSGIPDGTFVDSKLSPLPAGETPTSVAVADLDGDGRPDLVVDTWYGSAYGVQGGLGLGDGTFAFVGTGQASGAGTSLALADLDSDGVLDAVSCSSALGVFQGAGSAGLGDGTFGAAAVSAGLPGYGGACSLADLDGDGVLDAAASLFRSPTQVLAGGSALGLGDRTFVAAAGPGVGNQGGGQTRAPVAVDLNGDGVLDLVAGDGTAGFVALGQDQGFRAWSRPLSAPGAVIGIDTLPSFVDRFGSPSAPLTLGQHTDVDGHLASARSFVDHLRTSPLATPKGMEPLTLAWQVTGDLRWSREPGPTVVGVTDAGLRLRVVDRFGPTATAPGPSRAGLSLSTTPARGVVVELPILDARPDAELTTAAAAGALLVYRRSVDWRRADEVPADPLYQHPEGHAYLPRVPDGAGGWRDAVVETPAWAPIPYVPSLSSSTGSRFTVDVSDPTHRRLRVATDRLGSFEGFVVLTP